MTQPINVDAKAKEDLNWEINMALYNYIENRAGSEDLARRDCANSLTDAIVAYVAAVARTRRV